MNAPDRSAEVRRIWDEHPPEGLVDGKFPDDDVRRTYLLEVLLPELHKIDKQWGYLLKNGNHIPADIIVWQDTMEHFDVLSDTGPMWNPDGVVPDPNWTFGPVDNEVDPPVVLPPAPADDQHAEIIARLDRIEGQVNAIMGKLEHYDREFKAIQPELQALVAIITGGGVSGLANQIGPILGGLFKKK